jgi:hypothetical protein
MKTQLFDRAGAACRAWRSTVPTCATLRDRAGAEGWGARSC